MESLNQSFWIKNKIFAFNKINYLFGESSPKYTSLNNFFDDIIPKYTSGKVGKLLVSKECTNNRCKYYKHTDAGTKEKSITRKKCLDIIRKTFGEGADMEYFDKCDKQRGSFMVANLFNVTTGKPDALIFKVPKNHPLRPTIRRPKTKRTKTKRKTTM